MIVAKGDNGGYMGGLGQRSLVQGVQGVQGCAGLKRCVSIDSLSLFLLLIFLFSQPCTPCTTLHTKIHYLFFIYNNIIYGIEIEKKREKKCV